MRARPFGEYDVLARLATGGAANIFLARHPSAEPARRVVCLKTLLPARAKDRDFVDMFLDEARLASRLEHPCCVQLYGFGKAELTYYLAMEYILGETLWNLLTTVAELRKPLPPEDVASIIASACEGLHAAHELRDESGRAYNIVHRDISPQNIMVAYDGRTKVLDFGIAKAETGRQATATGIVKGKFSYMSPEQITGGSIDRRSDLYSLGIVMFECLASRRLYKADTPEEIARMMLERRPPRLLDLVPTIPPELDRICAKALARHANQRFSTAKEMGEAIVDYLRRRGYRHGPESVVRLVGQRFRDRIPKRRSMFESLVSGVYNESEMLETLGASPVLELDFQPEFSPEETLGDHGPGRGQSGSHSGSGSLGLNVELGTAGVPESVRMRDVPAMDLPDSTSHGLDLGPGGEVATVFDTGRPASGPNSGVLLVDREPEDVAENTFEEETLSPYEERNEETAEDTSPEVEVRRGLMASAAAPSVRNELGLPTVSDPKTQSDAARSPTSSDEDDFAGIEPASLETAPSIETLPALGAPSILPVAPVVSSPRAASEAATRPPDDRPVAPSASSVGRRRPEPARPMARPSAVSVLPAPPGAVSGVVKHPPAVAPAARAEPAAFVAPPISVPIAPPRSSQSVHPTEVPDPSLSATTGSRAFPQFTMSFVLAALTIGVAIGTLIGFLVARAVR